MSAAGSGSDWATETIAFLSDNLPRRSDCEGWDHLFTTAYQVGCMALVALGQADETRWGAEPRKNPVLPSVLPRWDDLCTAVLWLAQQKRKLSYRHPDGTVEAEGFGWTAMYTLRAALPPYEPNIAATDSLGPAYASPDVLSVLQALGLIADGYWTADAEAVLWRCQPRAWGMDVTSTVRFAEAVQMAVATVPDSTRREIECVVTITDNDFASHVVQYAAACIQSRVRYPTARVIRPMTVGQFQCGVVFKRKTELDDIFFRRWRLEGGWLSGDEPQRALHIFNDPLASRVRRAVVTLLHPDRPEFSS